MCLATSRVKAERLYVRCRPSGLCALRCPPSVLLLDGVGSIHTCNIHFESGPIVDSTPLEHSYTDRC